MNKRKIKNMTNIDITFRIINILVIGVSAFIAISTLRKTQEWNRRKTTHEFINELVFGEYPELSKVLIIDLKIKVFNKTTDYLTAFNNLDDDKKDILRYTTSKIFNLFEVLSISIKNNVVDENICYDYLGHMYTEYYRWGIDFIKIMRTESNEPRVLVNFENCAIKWQQRINNEITVTLVPGKEKL